jgi:hypothetical protein
MRIISAVKRVEFVNDGMLYIILRGHWYHIIVLNIHAPTEDKTEDIFKPTIENESLHKISTDNGDRIVNLCTWMSPEGKIHNQIDHILSDRQRHSSVLDV